MSPKLCVHGNKQFSCESRLNQHTKSSLSGAVRSLVGDASPQKCAMLCDNKLGDLRDFWELEMSKQMREWNSSKLRKYTLPVFYILTHISRALSRDNTLKSIMETAKHFRDTRGLCYYEAMGFAVSEKQSEIRDKLELSVKEPESDDDDLETCVWVFNAD